MRSDLPIALPLNLFIDYDDPLGVDADQAAADVGVFQVPYKCEVVQAGLMITETSEGDTTKGVVDFDKRPTCGSDTDRGDGDIGHFVMGTTSAGKVLYDKVAIGTVLYPGDEVVVQLSTAATGTNKAGHFRPFLLVQHIPEVVANLSDMVETA